MKNTVTDLRPAYPQLTPAMRRLADRLDSSYKN
jgi:hypothetical protein